MSTASYVFGQNGTQTEERTSGLSGTYFYTTIPITIRGVFVAAAQKDENVDAFVTAVLTTSDGITAQETVQIFGGRDNYRFTVTLSVNADTWYNLTFYTNNSVVYWDNTAVTEYIVSGWTGTAITPSSIQPYACGFTVVYDPVWVTDGQNDGYARIAAYDAEEFTEFAKDQDGYPTNWSVWKLDDHNDGYPWITGYLPYRERSAQVYVVTDNELLPCMVFVVTDTALIPASIMIL